MVAQAPQTVIVRALGGLEACARCGARGQSVCSAIDDGDLGKLGSIAVTRDFARGQSFVEEGEPATDFFNITQGTAKLYKMLPDGRQQITGFARTGHFLGLAASNTYGFSAEAVEPVRACRFSRQRFRGLMEEFPALERRLLDSACHELVIAQEHVLLLGRKTARERLASFLMTQRPPAAPCSGPGSDAANLIHLPMPRRDIADYLGLTIETISRTLGALKADRLIAVPNQTEVVILDAIRLQELAGGERE
jgi:CRP/FNR family transcriptional regulator